MNVIGASQHYGRTRWKAGDVVGCFLDLTTKSMSFALNGDNLGVAFTNVAVGSGLYPAISISVHQQCRFNFGHTPFK
jgi:hypothetical protein